MAERPVIPEENFSPRVTDDDRPPLPTTADERTTLTAFLDHHRATLAVKCRGLDREQLSTRVVAPSSMTLHGLLRHIAAVERWWFRIQLAGEDVPLLFYSDDDPGQDFDTLDTDPADVLALWQDECARSRAIVAERSLDDTGTRIRDGEPFSVRWVLTSMIAEYARHNGHADLLREATDGETGA